MKIGIDGRALTERRAGIGNYTYEIIKNLNNVDKENEYIIYSNKNIVLDDIKLNDNWKLSEKISKIPGSFWLYFNLPKILKNDNIDIFWGTQHCLPKRNSKTRPIKFVLTIHDLAIQKIKNIGSTYNTLIQKLFLKKSCENADKIIAVSNSTKQDLKDILKIENNKIAVIYEGVNELKKVDLSDKDKNEILNKFKLKEEEPFLFFLSTIEPRKNLDTAIKAFELFKKNNKSNLKFIISGGIGWKSENTLKLIQESEYKNDIIQTGYISKEEKKYFFENCTCFVYPSLYEGFGLPILEAMQNKAIIITTNISSIPEVGGDIPLYLNNVYDEKELSELINKVIKMDEIERKSRLEKCLEQTKKFSWEKCSNETLNIFLNV